MYVDEGVPTRSTGDITRKYAEISSDKGGENPPHRKSKGFRAR